MKNNLNINPIGLKGQEQLNEMRRLMGIKPLNENIKSSDTSKVELSKVGPDGKTYGIVREKHEFYIKVADKKDNILAEDFKYIGGLQNKKSEMYETYAKAIKHLNLKFINLNESLGKTDKINVFENDNIVKENKFAGGMGFVQEEEVVEEEVMTEEEKLKLENEQAIDEMKNKEYGVVEYVKESKKGKYSISDAISENKMDEIIDSTIVNEDKINDILLNLNEAELKKLAESLKKKA